LSGGEVVEQLIRPTGLVDPNIELRPIDGQIEDLVIEIIARKQLGQRVLVTTLTKKMSEALTAYLNDTEKIDKLVASYKEKEAAGRAAAEVTGGEDVTIWSEPHLPVEKMGTSRIPKQYYHHLQKSSAASLEPGQLDYPKVAYLHSDIETLERSDILDDLRRGEYDVVVGINLLREGLDLPEVSLVAILDADKSGFLRSRTSLIQTMGRAARHVEGHAILYADYTTQGMLEAIEETLRRRTAQIAYNRQHDITPRGISKPIRKRMIEKKADADERGTDKRGNRGKKSPNSIIVQLTKNEQIDLAKIDPSALTPYDRKKLAERLRRRMNQAAKDMDFELAAILRDTIRNLG
jgi:excinuclease UvrABC helicase subunit UvrB